jgi:hypothetical protein
VQQGIDADLAQFNEEQAYPFKMVQFMQSLLDGLPLGATNTDYMDSSWFTDLAAGYGGIEALLEAIFGSQTGDGTDGTDAAEGGTPPQTGA